MSSKLEEKVGVDHELDDVVWGKFRLKTTRNADRKLAHACGG